MTPFGGADGLLMRLIVKDRLTKSSGSTSLDAEFDRDFIAPRISQRGDARPFFSAPPDIFSDTIVAREHCETSKAGVKEGSDFCFPVFRLPSSL